MRGRDVRVLQGYLSKVGVRTKVDGQYGPATTSSVRRWERSNLRPTDGKVAPDDAQALRDQVDITSMGGAQYRPPTPVAPDPGPQPDPNQPPPPPGQEPTGPAGEVTFNDDGTAIAPADAPPEVKAMIAAANQIHAIPYQYGGGHAPYRGNPPKPPKGADCSGSVSWVLHAADKLDNPLDSSGLMTWGEAGAGQWVTVYSNPGHVYMTIGNARFDTSGMDDKSRWDTRKRSSRGYKIRHPEGL
jgi:cell wall-associated NlpC family hydrolase